VKYSELNKKTVADLQDQSKDLREDLFRLRLKHKTQQLEDKSKICQTKKDVARVMTKLTELKKGKKPS